MVAGGAEASITPIGVAGFTALTALNTTEDPSRASIPFDAERGGFIMGEGAGVVVLESLEHAQARGAKIYAELAGYGATGDAYHITSPAEDGSGAAKAMEMAIADAGMKPEDVDYINAHGTSTHHNDLFETKAIKLALGDHAYKTRINSTKSMDGHGAAVGGAIVDSGKFDWMVHAEKFPGLCTPDESYHGITYAEKFGKEGAFITKCTAQLMRDFGCIQSPQNAFLLNLGLESLHVRMPRHVENGQAVAEYLLNHPKVAYVNYSGLPSDKYYALAQKYLPNGGCGVVSFGLKGGRKISAPYIF